MGSIRGRARRQVCRPPRPRRSGRGRSRWPSTPPPTSASAADSSSSSPATCTRLTRYASSSSRSPPSTTTPPCCAPGRASLTCASRAAPASRPKRLPPSCATDTPAARTCSSRSTPSSTTSTSTPTRPRRPIRAGRRRPGRAPGIHHPAARTRFQARTRRPLVVRQPVLRRHRVQERRGRTSSPGASQLHFVAGGLHGVDLAGRRLASQVRSLTRLPGSAPDSAPAKAAAIRSR